MSELEHKPGQISKEWCLCCSWVHSITQWRCPISCFGQCNVPAFQPALVDAHIVSWTAGSLNRTRKVFPSAAYVCSNCLGMFKLIAECSSRMRGRAWFGQPFVQSAVQAFRYIFLHRERLLTVGYLLPGGAGCMMFKSDSPVSKLHHESQHCSERLQIKRPCCRQAHLTTRTCQQQQQQSEFDHAFFSRTGVLGL